VSSNLAIALAQGGAKVLLVDGNVREASLSVLYGKAGRPGLADLLTGMSSRTEVAQFTAVPRLALLPAGQSRGNPAEMLEPEELTRVFASLATTADVVVVDSGPVLAVSDPIALASVSDVVVVVADPRRTTRTDLRAVAREISSSGKRHVVGVLNNAPGTRAGMSAPPAAPARQQGSNGAVKAVVLPQTVTAQPVTAQSVTTQPVTAQPVNANNDGSASRPDSHESGA
jgi:capsular exopolysaccharide synthesis family protein